MVVDNNVSEKDKVKRKTFKGTVDEAKIKAKELRDQQRKDKKLKENTVRGTGTHFEIKDSDGSNITLDSDIEIKVNIKYSLKRIMFHIERSHKKEKRERGSDKLLNDLPSSAQITISGLKAGMSYHKKFQMENMGYTFILITI